jgi:hypothetical protein
MTLRPLSILTVGKELHFWDIKLNDFKHQKLKSATYKSAAMAAMHLDDS